MAEKAQKVYLNGGGKEIVFRDGGTLINGYIDVDDAKAKGAIRKSKKGTNFLSFTIAKRKEEGEFGDTHYLYFTDFEGNTKKGGGTSSGKPSASKPASTRKRMIDEDEDDDGDNLPF